MTSRGTDNWESLLEKANAVLFDMAGQYPQTALRALDRADAVLASPRVPAAAIRDDFFPIVHNIKGQGATFGYPLMTEVGAFLCAYIRARKKFNTQDVALFRRYVAEMRAIAGRRLTGDGGAFGAGLRRKIQREQP
ncbi:MAG: hypothetical protein PHX68_02895 [Alphaproteobacteria bacterium]|nr:hypothetical protein [Alphaproteobacteria bacterium]